MASTQTNPLGGSYEEVMQKLDFAERNKKLFPGTSLDMSFLPELSKSDLDKLVEEQKHVTAIDFFAELDIGSDITNPNTIRILMHRIKEGERLYGVIKKDQGFDHYDFVWTLDYNLLLPIGLIEMIFPKDSTDKPIINGPTGRIFKLPKIFNNSSEETYIIQGGQITNYMPPSIKEDILGNKYYALKEFLFKENKKQI